MSNNAQHTRGPWRWVINSKSKEVRLEGGPRFDLTVLDFVRWGPGSAAPRFRTESGPALDLMKHSEEFAREVPGREHHANWFRALSHPDAKLIEAAPDLLSAAKALVASVTDNACAELDDDAPPELRAMVAAIAKAEGQVTPP